MVRLCTRRASLSTITGMPAETFSHYKDILIVLAAAGIVIPLLLRLGVSSILGFLVVGLLLGPHVLGRLAAEFPMLETLRLGDAEEAAGAAELGVVFLLFLIGLELSFERLKTMRRLVFGLGGLQVVASVSLLALGASLLGFDRKQAIILGMALALSSTAIIIQLFSEEKRLGSQAGRLSFAVLLMQDLAVIPMLLAVTAFATRQTDSVTLKLLFAAGQALLAAGLIVIVGRFALTPLLRFVAKTQSPDLFMAVVLFIALGTGAVATLAGLSMALGAFIAGLVLAETEYRRAIEAIIEPFKGLLLGLFFLLVGLNLDLALLLKSPLQIAATAVAVMVIKTLVVMALGALFRLPSRSVFESAMLLGPGGEFAFVILASATAAGLFGPGETASSLLLVTLTMMLIPLLAKLAKSLRSKLEATRPSDPIMREAPPEQQNAHVIIAGFGRVGTLVADMLKEQDIPYLAVDVDVGHVSRGRKSGYEVYFGNAADPQFLETCGLSQARALAVTMDAPARVEEIIRTVRTSHKDIKIIARARDERHAQKLYGAGVTEAVPETIEASLQLAEAILVETGVPMGLAIAAVHERRDVSRKLLGRPDRRAEVARARNRLRASKPGV
jgi:Kef-type K+ transport system membrane component KefB/voltage-gated potassium channel Kch